MTTTNLNFKVKNGLDAAGVVTSAGLSLLSTTSPITLNGSTGTSGQILTSAGTGATPTWASSFSGFLSTTNTGKTGLIAFITPGANSQATWANYPVGLGTMVNANQASNGLPNNNYHYFFKVANRDFGGGWGGLSIDYATGDLYTGRADTSSVYATWHRLANTSLANTFAGVQTFSDTITHNGFYQNFNNMLTSGRMTIGLSTLSSGVQLGVYSTSATNVGTIIRAAVSQSANLLEIQNSASSILSRFSSSGQFVSDQQTYIGSGATSISNARFNLATGSASVVGQVVRGAANQLEDTIEIQNSAGTSIGGFSGVGQVFTGSTNPITTSTGGATTATSGTGTVATITTTSAHSLATGDRVTVAGVTPTGYNGTFIVTGTPTTTTFTYANTTTGSQTVAGTVRVDAQASITSRSAATVGLLVRAAASQSSNPFEVQNSSGTVIANITSAGGVRATGTLQGSTISAVTDGSTIATLSASGNVQFRGAASYGGGVGVIGIANATTAPTSNPTGGGLLFVNAGALQYRGTSGNAATIVNADGTMAGYTLPTATATVLGGVELFDNATQTTAANTVTTTASRTYGLQLNSNLQGVVNVPWTDTSGHTLIASSAFSSAPSFSSIPQTYKRLYAVIVFSTLGTFSGALTYTVNGAGTGYSRFQPGVSTSFTTSAGAAAVLTLAATAPVVGNSYWVEINNYTQTNSRSIGSGSVYTFGNVIPAEVTSLAFAASTSWGGATGTAYLYGVN